MKKIVLFVVFLVLGTQVLYIGGYWSTPPEATRTMIKVVNLVFSSAAAFACFRLEKLKPYYPVALAFAVSALGLFLAWTTQDWTTALLKAAPVSPRGVALLKFAEAVPMVLPALILIPIFGKGYGSIYLQRGKLGRTLLLGLGLAAVLVAFFLLISDAGPKAKSSLSFAGWMLLFAFSNAFMEELLVRGLFLRPFEKFFTPFISLLLTTLLFTIMHFDASYLNSDNMIMAISYIFFLGLTTGAIIQRSDSIWGAVLAHAAADVMLLISTFGTVG
jgi:membrane protease YdiL (CAAX protease family)